MNTFTIVLLAAVALLQVSLSKQNVHDDDVVADNAAVEAEDITDAKIEAMVAGGFNYTWAPFLVRILWNGNFRGNGILIDRDTVLTTAFTIVNPRDNIEIDPAQLRVHAGLVNLSNLGRGFRSIRVTSVQAHHDYVSNRNQTNNIAVVKLAYPVRVNRLLAPTSLATSVAPSGNRQASVLSWGSTTRWGSPANHVQLASFRTVSHWQFRRQNPRVQLPANTFLLANTRNIATTHSDNGAPVWLNSQVLGLVSYSPNRNVTVVTHITPYTQWINDVKQN